MANVALRGVPEGMYETLKEAAKRNHRSLNGEILTRLEASFRSSATNAEAILARVAERSAQLHIPRFDDALLSDLKDAGRS